MGPSLKMPRTATRPLEAPKVYLRHPCGSLTISTELEYRPGFSIPQVSATEGTPSRPRPYPPLIDPPGRSISRR